MYRLWVPGPDGNFFSDLGYLHGFVQLQDVIDKAIINILTKRSTSEEGIPDEVGVFTQQQPYPCFTRDK